MPQAIPSISIQSSGSSASNNVSHVNVSSPAIHQHHGLRPGGSNDVRMTMMQPHLYRSNSNRSIASVTSHTSAPFEVQRSARRKIQRRGAPIVGTGRSDRFRGAPEPSRELFVFRVEHGYTADDIKKYITDSNIVIRDIEQTSKDGSTFLSFKVSIKLSDMNVMLQPDFWPMGVCVRRFRRPRPQYVESNDG